MTTEHAPADRWNFAALLVQGVARRVANELTSEKLVLPFLYTALGGAVFFSGLFAPLVVVTRLVAQLLGARLVEVARRGKIYVAWSVGLAALVFAFLGAVADGVAAHWLPIIFLGAAALLGVFSGLGALAFQDMIGRILADRTRIRLLFGIGAASGAMVIVVTIVSQVLTGFEPDEQPSRDHVHLLWAGIAMMLVSALAAAAVRETPRVSAETDAPVSENYLASLYQGAQTVLRLPWFRRFMVARVLFLTVEMVVPFFAVHAAVFHATVAPGLSLFVISLSLGLTVGGLVWPHVSKKSIQLVLSLSALVAFGAAILAFANHMADGVQHPMLHAAMIFMLAVATQGTMDGSAAYVIRSADDHQRPYCISVSNLAAGLIGIAIALAAGTIAEGQGVIWAIVIMGALNLVAAVYALSLEDVSPESGQARRAGKP